MARKCFHDAAKNLLKEWNRKHRRGGFPLQQLYPGDVKDLENAIAEKFEWYVHDGIEFGLIPPAKVESAIAELESFINSN